ncbi:MAG: helix-turn-helix domain-containing protein [Anaerolineae bacterium]|nr:helix-turn-helix domain-containing protein [Anaerolineae bacterium]
MDKIELVSHPIRMRVILTIGSRILTTRQLAELLPDVPQTTLYRHIHLLLKGGILTIVRESQIRGTVEREFALVKGGGRLDLETSASLSPEQSAQIFTTFIAMLLADFNRAQLQPVQGMPPAFYTQQRLYLSAEELGQLSQEMESLLAKYKDQFRLEDAPHTQSWLFTGIAMRDTEIPPADQEND